MYDPLNCSTLVRVQLRLDELCKYYNSVVYAHVPAETHADFQTGCEQLRQAIRKDLEHGGQKWTSHNAELRRLHGLWCGMGGASSIPDDAPRDCPQRDYDDFFRPRTRPEPRGVHLSGDDSNRATQEETSWGVGLPIYRDPDQIGKHIEENPETLHEYWPPVVRRPKRRAKLRPVATADLKTTT